ncbi:hypothetical protein [Methylomonas sp. UP202]|uniref:hypothetical protein n=1 Tax=Methylomonas sp. UP202 TaxID=3040943 RepID=UPI0024783596|nr:hypothetical protein [Methylomonas sp. UP202]WGS88591.1 hypothetical protein QC632_24920 [Methylomonas sp. UP202]
MSYFLWVEDFENEARVTAANVFGGVLDEGLFDDKRQALKYNFKSQGVFIELNFQDGLDFICSKLDTVDYVILDIDLPAYGDDGINQDVLNLLVNFEGYQPQGVESEDEALQKNACSELKKIAGFYLYTKLVVELGFPKEHILFCSNHGENTQTIQQAFKTARMALPKIYQKSDDVVQQWVKQRYDDPYSRLRRGIIEGCKLAKSLPKENVYFNNFIPKQDSIQHEDIISYFQILENFLPLREPENKLALYKLFIRTLSHEWGATDPKKIKELAWIMKNVRNWVSHNSLLFSCIDEKLLAYLFIINLRLMFDFDSKVQSYETILLALFSHALTEQLFKDKAKNDLLKPDIAKTYLDLKNKVLDEKGKDGVKINDGFYFNELANNIQQSNSHLKDDKQLFSELIYQMFWLTTSNPYVGTSNQKKTLEIKFYGFNYLEKPYIEALARHIYHCSFSPRPNP